MNLGRLVGSYVPVLTSYCRCNVRVLTSVWWGSSQSARNSVPQWRVSAGRVFSTSVVGDRVMSMSEFGAWRSPVTSQLATQSAVSFQELHLDRAPGRTDTVYWSELRGDEGGRYVVCSATLGQPGHTQWTPEAYNARTRVHEYGGGALTVHDGVVYFSNYKDQRLYKQTAPESEPVAVTPEGSHCRYADGQFCQKLGKLFYVCEDHSEVVAGKNKEPVNTLVALDPTTGQQCTLASGCDFYASPRVSDDGVQIAWVQWNHPNMPWDDTTLVTATLSDNGTELVPGTEVQVLSGQSVIHPRWTPDRQLLYIGDQTDWWNLYLVPSGGQQENVCQQQAQISRPPHQVPSGGQHVNLYPQEAEIGHPHWIFCDFVYDMDPSGSGTLVFQCNKKLHLLNLSSRQSEEIETGFESHSFIQFSADGHLYCAAGSPTRFTCIVRINIKTKAVDVLRESRQVPVDSGYLSVPQKMTWPTANGETAHGFYYPPQNKDFSGPGGSLPPLLVKVHGGPTANCSTVLNLKIQYFTSRGFGLLDVDYRGSTGYGRPYRNKLRGNWGICDVEDCSSGALYLAEQKLVDRNRLCIDGGSAGGYTTLACLAFTDTFKAGASHYGVADIGVLAAETHKFESRYIDLLIAPYNEENMHLYDSRSPMKHIDKFNCPIAFFQGDEDEVVPPNQAQMMYDAVKAKGLPTVLVLFKGEQHGFRISANIRKALDGEFYFYSKVFGFQMADQNVTLDIANMK